MTSSFSNDQTYGFNNPMANITPKETDQMRKRLLDNISDLNGNKHRMTPDEYNQLLNYHHYALTILDNMKIISHADSVSKYNNGGTAQYDNNIDVIYKRDGRAALVDKNKRTKFVGEWEKQFDSNVINPPCYQVPPTNYWGSPRTPMPTTTTPRGSHH